MGLVGALRMIHVLSVDGNRQVSTGMIRTYYGIEGVPSEEGRKQMKQCPIVMLSHNTRTIFCVCYGWSNLSVWADETIRIEIVHVGSLG